MKKLICILLAVILIFSFASVANAQITKDQYYARTTLSGNELEYYDDLYNAITNGHGLDGSDYGISDDRAYQIAMYVYNDAPELYNWDDKYTAKEVKNFNTELKQKSEQIIGLLNNNMTEYEKVKTIYYYIAKNTEYGMSTEAQDKGQTIVGAMLYGKATCAGLSNALQYLFYQIDIPCYTVTNNIHAWNIIKIDGEWYHADITIDQQYIKYGTSELQCFLWDDSFLKTGEHVGDDDQNPPLPACTSQKYMQTEEAAQTTAPKTTGVTIPKKILERQQLEAQQAAATEEAETGQYIWWIIGAGIAAAVIILLLRRKKK